MRRRRGARPVWQRALFGLVVATLVFWVAEMGLRIAGIEAAFSAEAIAGWRTTSNLQSAPMDSHGETFRVTTNEHGLRTSLPQQRTGAVRIALLGDSTVFGWGADEGGSVADGLQRAMGDVEVLNAGQPGYSTFQASWLFQEVVGDYQPDLTIVFVPLHDDNLVLVSDREQIEGAGSAGAWLRILLARHSRLYGLLRSALFRSAGTAAVVPIEPSDGEPRVPRVSQDDRRVAVQRMKDHAATWGGDVAIGLLPFLGDLTHSPIPKRASADAAAEVATELGIPLVDVRACCGPHGGGLVLPNDPGHLTAEGNQAVGDALGEAVEPLVRW